MAVDRNIVRRIGLSLFTDFENFTTFKPGPHLEPTVTIMLDQVTALRPESSCCIRASRGPARPPQLQRTHVSCCSSACPRMLSTTVGARHLLTCPAAVSRLRQV